MQRSFLPPLDALYSFVSAARMGSFSAAAAELNLTQSAVSRQIQKLEERLGVPLFTRVRQRVQLTPAGTAYLADVRKVLDDLGQATIRVRKLADADRKLEIAVQPTVATCWLIPRLPSFLQKHPHLDLDLSVRTEPSNELDHFDLVIQRGRAEGPGFITEILFENELSAVCSREFIKSNAVRSVFDLLNVRRIHHSTRPSCWSDWFTTLGLDDGGQKKQGIWLERIPMIIQAVLSGVGVALLPEFLIEEHMRSGAVVAVHDQSVKIGEDYYVVQARAAEQKNEPLMAWIRHERDNMLGRANSRTAVKLSRTAKDT